MNKRVLISLSVIGIVAAIVIGGTISYFSDTETSTGNTFTAGTLDLKVDSACHYNGNTCVNGYWTGASPYPAAGTPCSCTWTLKDLGTGDLFFNYSDVKPGDYGENTISFRVYDNDAHLCAYVTNLTNAENGCNEPEGNVDQSCGVPGVGEGELQDNIYVTIWKDTDCDNVLDEGETVLVNNEPIDNNAGGWYLGVISKDQTTCVGLSWNVPSGVGNIIQSDSVTGNISFYAEQVRNNSDFNCPTTLP